MDEYSKFPVVFEVPTTAADHVLPKLEDLFSFIGIPMELKSDNGPPFNGQKFTDFADDFGFIHRKIIPEAPNSNGHVEGFMKNLTKIMQTAKTERKPWKKALVEFLRAYRSTPHSSTGVAPSQLLFGFNRTNRLPSAMIDSVSRDEYKKMAQINDKAAKLKAKTANDSKRHAKTHSIKEDDLVLVQQKRLNKFINKYATEPVKVKSVTGPMITVEEKEGRVLTRNAEKFKPFFSPVIKPVAT